MAKDNQKLDELITAIVIDCNGTNIRNRKTIEEKPEAVIVKFYKDGHSMPLCRYLTGENANQCSAFQAPENYGFCLYRTIK
jgi:hypothetical protein